MPNAVRDDGIDGGLCEAQTTVLGQAENLLSNPLVNTNATAAATITGPSYTLTLTIAGYGSGYATSSIPGFACSSGSCSVTVENGPVVLIPFPASGPSLGGWGGR